MYQLMQNFLFRLPPEAAHDLALAGLDVGQKLGLLEKIIARPVDLPVRVMGLDFPNPVGLAAGLDKNADHLDALGALGFGFIEVGTVTPVAQYGNPKPRMFRLPEHQAIINRMGFNNHGLEHLLDRVSHRRYPGILGINVGKNKVTPAEASEQDYRKGIAAVYVHADYITVNVSSPNTPGLRDLQFGDSLKGLMQVIKAEQARCHKDTGRYVPIAIKIAPDLEEEGIRFIASALKDSGLDAVIATNTTISRTAVAGHKYANEAGGLSGLPVRDPSTLVIKALYAELGEAVPIIGVGGVTDGHSAAEKIRAGAKLVQLYTGLIYRGPGLISESVEAIRALGQQ